MIEIVLTFSASSFAVRIPSEVEDRIHLHYASCDYCDTPVRAEQILSHRRRFCSDRDRSLYHYHFSH